jgi:hypothetical protein
LNTVFSNGLVIGAIYGLVALGITLVHKKFRGRSARRRHQQLTREG